MHVFTRAKDFLVAVAGSLKWRNRTCILNDVEIKRKILFEAHESPYRCRDQKEDFI